MDRRDHQDHAGVHTAATAQPTGWKAYLFDWGDTLMRDIPGETGAMHTWTRVEVMPHAETVLQQLARVASCFLATNARDSTRDDIIQALRRVGLARHLTDIFCYREIGHAKPSRQYFDEVLRRLAARGLARHEVVMVGDSIETDIRGAEENGIEAILLDLEDRHRQHPGRRITDLRMLLDLR